jgi:hypothetical protein
VNRPLEEAAGSVATADLFTADLPGVYLVIVKIGPWSSLVNGKIAAMIEE